MKKLLLAIVLTFFVTNAYATIYYVRTDGGTGTQCTGTTDAAYPGSGTGQACAYNHPNWSLPSYGDATQPTTYEMSGGDVLVIHGPDDGAGTGSYRMGCQNDSTNCEDTDRNYVSGGEALYSYGNHKPPSGSLGAETYIVGCSWTGNLSTSGCGTDAKPELWLVGRLEQLFNLTDKDYITFKDIEITDHWGSDAECDQYFPTKYCGRGGFAAAGGWSNLSFIGMDIHGLTYSGFGGANTKFSGSGVGDDIGTWLIKDSNIDGNKSAGINMDTSGDGTDGIEGTITFDNVNMRWNGCSEAYPVVWGADGEDGVVGRLPISEGCRTQGTGGYGDMIGTEDTGGDWTFTDCNFSHNTNDAIDLLYCDTAYGGCTVTVKRTLFEGNNGQLIKVGYGTVFVEDSLLIGNCSFWGENSGGYEYPGFNVCRAGGTPVSVSFYGNGDEATFINNTILSEGDVMFLSDGGTSCVWNNYNNILVGGYQYCQDLTSMYYPVDCTTAYTINEDYNICWKDFKDDASYTECSNTNDQLDVDPDFTGEVYTGETIYTCAGNRYTGTQYYLNLSLLSTSVAIDAADETVTGADEFDFWEDDRGVSWDIGADEYSPLTSSFLPKIQIFF